MLPSPDARPLSMHLSSLRLRGWVWGLLRALRRGKPYTPPHFPVLLPDGPRIAVMYMWEYPRMQRRTHPLK